MTFILLGGFMAKKNQSAHDATVAKHAHKAGANPAQQKKVRKVSIGVCKAA
jgi:hypothetical protein